MKSSRGNFSRLALDVRARGKDFKMPSLLRMLVVDLQMKPSSMSTKRLAIEMLSRTDGQRIIDSSDWKFASKSQKSRHHNWHWRLEHLDRNLFSLYLSDFAEIIGRSRLAHLPYLSFD